MATGELNYYSDLDARMELFAQVRQDVLSNAAQLANKPASRTIYSTPSRLLGLHTPTLLLGIFYSHAFKKGRKLNSPGDRKDYLSYEYDEEGNLLRITHHGQKPQWFYLFTTFRDYQWAIPIFRFEDRYCYYPCDAMFTKWDPQGRVQEFGSVRGSHLRLEKYTYAEENSGAAWCEVWSYVPNLENASKAIPVFQTGTPADYWKYQLDISDPKKIQGQLLESSTHDNSVFRTDPHCPIAPQKIYKKPN